MTQSVNEQIGVLPTIKPKLYFAQVGREMLGRQFVPCADNPALQERETARKYPESRLWPNATICPHCASGARITVRKDGYYRCNACKVDFTVRTATIFERSHVPLHKWVYAMYLLVTARKGISSMQLAKEIGITQKSAWFVLHRLREACGKDLDKLRGHVEIDETSHRASDL